MLAHGEWPAAQIDHVKGDKDDNRLVNLRQASNAQNNRNVKKKSSNTSGFKGVCWDKERSLWMASICVDRRQKTLGRFGTPEEAYSAYVTAARTFHGEFARIE
jgi:hypothetical protein